MEVSEYKDRKRSKRHRTHRNNISDKERVNSVREFGIYCRAVDKAYRAKFKKPERGSIYEL